MSQNAQAQRPAEPARAAQAGPKRAKTAFSENMNLARAALAVALIVSLFVMGPAKLSGLRKDAQRAFRSGVSDKYVASVYNDIRTAADSADTLAGVCGLTLGTEDEGVKTLSSIAAELRETDDEETMLRRFKVLKSETERVYTAFTDKETDANRIDQAKRCYYNITSAYTTVGNDSYFALADDYNRTISAFPANLMAGMRGLDKLPTDK